jgi:tetratricopeptide (TPR) repeat protein
MQRARKVGSLAMLASALFFCAHGSALAQGAPAEPSETMAQSTTTEADMADAQARGHFRLGREYYEQGRFAEAATAFEAAYGLSGRPSLLYNVYLAYRDAQDTRNAARSLRGYLAAVADAPDREHLSARLQALDATLAQEQAAAAQRQAETEAAQQRAEAAERERAESERRAAEAERRSQLRPTRPWWPWLLVGGGVAAAGTGVVLGVLAKGDADELRGDCVTDPHTAGAMAPLTEGNACAPAVDVSSRRDSIQSRALIGDVLWISGAVIGVTGIVLAFALPDEYPTLDEPRVAAACSTHACRATLRTSF